MLKELYVSYDKVSVECSEIMACKNKAQALRAFNTMLERADRPDDYKLWLIGIFDTETGEINNIKCPEEVFVTVGDDDEESVHESGPAETGKK